MVSSQLVDGFADALDVRLAALSKMFAHARVKPGMGVKEECFDEPAFTKDDLEALFFEV